MLLTATILAGMGSAHADSFICLQPMNMLSTQPLGGQSREIDVTKDGPTWRVFHWLNDGRLISREDQYDMTDRPGSEAMWVGRHKRNPALVMAGHVMGSNEGISYQETLYDTAHGNRLVASILATCQPKRAASAYVPPAPQAPMPLSMPAGGARQPGPQDGDSVPIVVTDGAQAHVNVMLGSIAVTMLVDTGATIGSVDPLIAQNLITSGEASEAGTITVVLAGGRQVEVRRIVVNTLTIGAHRVNNVSMMVNDQSSPMLLPFTVLNQMGRVNIDLANRRLAFGG